MTAITFPTAEQMAAATIAARLAEPDVDAAEIARRVQHRASMRLMRERAVEDQAELVAFCAVIAEHFGCPGLAQDHVQGRLASTFRELRTMATRLNGEADRRAADPTAAAVGRQRK